jgi:hypothetical protein
MLALTFRKRYVAKSNSRSPTTALTGSKSHSSVNPASMSVSRSSTLWGSTSITQSETLHMSYSRQVTNSKYYGRRYTQYVR